MEQYLTVKQVQDILGFSKTKTYALVNQKDFPKIRIGNDIRIPRTAFFTFLENLMYKEYKL